MRESLAGHFLAATWLLTVDMAPYLLFGFLVAGILHVLIPEEKIASHLAGRGIASVFKAALIGVPLPLCSCGIIPVSASLRRSGAGKGSTVAFLISTPMTGVDSILATYSLLGGVFALIRVVTAFLAGILGGLLVNLLDPDGEDRLRDDAIMGAGRTIDADGTADTGGKSGIRKIIEIFRYGFIVLINDVGKWLVIGILGGGAISALLPPNALEGYLGDPFLSYPLMLLIGIPMYVCATGSIPIAAALIMKGMSPGAGLVFLIAGPATNTAAVSFVAGKLGKRTCFIYLVAIMIVAVAFGVLLDHTALFSPSGSQHVHDSGVAAASWSGAGSAWLLVLLIVSAPFLKGIGRKKTPERGVISAELEVACERCEKKRPHGNLSGHLSKSRGSEGEEE